MKSLPKIRSRLATALLLAGSGGTLFSSCETRFRDAFVAGTKDFFLSFLDPQNLANFLASSNPNQN